MEKDILTPVPAGRVYSIRQIILATFFGGMFAAAFLLAGNFKTFDQKQKVFGTWVYAVILFFLLGVSAFIPALDKIPGIIYTIVITALIAVYVNAQQKKLIEAHITNGGEVHGGGRVLAVTLVGIVLMVGFVLLSFWLSDMYIGSVEQY
jgi:hypothetical protein